MNSATHQESQGDFTVTVNVTAHNGHDPLTEVVTLDPAEQAQAIVIKVNSDGKNLVFDILAYAPGVSPENGEDVADLLDQLASLIHANPAKEA